MGSRQTQTGLSSYDPTSENSCRCRFEEQKRARLEGHVYPQQLVQALSGMSSGRQPQLWDDLAEGQFQIPLLFVAGERDPKFVDLASRMAALAVNAGSSGLGAHIGHTDETVHHPMPAGIDTAQVATHRDSAAQPAQFEGKASTTEPVASLDGTASAAVASISPDQLGMRGSSAACHCGQAGNAGFALIAGAGHACHIERPELLYCELWMFLQMLTRHDRNS